MKTKTRKGKYNPNWMVVAAIIGATSMANRMQLVSNTLVGLILTAFGVFFWFFENKVKP